MPYETQFFEFEQRVELPKVPRLPRQNQPLTLKRLPSSKCHHDILTPSACKQDIYSLSLLDQCLYLRYRISLIISDSTWELKIASFARLQPTTDFLHDIAPVTP